MPIKPLYFTTELLAGDGETRGPIIGPVRVLAADKIAAKATCRKQRWDYSDSPHILMGYYAMRRAGLTTADDFAAFESEVLDYAVSNPLDDDQDDEDETDPTAPGSSY